MIATITKSIRMAAILSMVGVMYSHAEPRHDFYVCVNVASRGSVMGTKLANLSGLYRATDRTMPVHVGFNHIRLETVAAEPMDPKQLYASALNGVLRTQDGGISWRIMTGWEMTESKDIAVDSNSPGHVYACLPDGLAVSRDRGWTWKRSDEGIKRKYCQSVVVDRNQAGRLVIGTEKGIFLSEDAANTWRCVQHTEATVYDVRQSPHAASVWFAVTQSDGAFRSSDGGRAWTRVASLTKDCTLHNLDFDANDARKVLVCGWGLGVRLSEDGGETWIDRTPGLPRSEVWRVAFDPDFPGRIYASVYQSPVFVSDDLGKSWRALWFESAVVHDFVFIRRS